MDKEMCLKMHSKLHDTSIKEFTELGKDPETMAVKMQIMGQTLADKFYQMTGIETQELDHATEFLKLEQDKEF